MLVHGTSAGEPRSFQILVGITHVNMPSLMVMGIWKSTKDGSLGVLRPKLKVMRQESEGTMVPIVVDNAFF